MPNPRLSGSQRGERLEEALIARSALWIVHAPVDERAVRSAGLACNALGARGIGVSRATSAPVHRELGRQATGRALLAHRRT